MQPHSGFKSDTLTRGSLIAPRGICYQFLNNSASADKCLFSKCSHLILGLNSLYSSQIAEAPAFSFPAVKITGLVDLWQD